MSLILFVEYVGIASAALSGFLFAVKRECDWLGVFLSAFLTALGGGIVRDMLVGRAVYSFTHYMPVSVVIFMLVASRITNLHIKRDGLEKKFVFIFADAIDVICFSIVGAMVAIEYSYNFILYHLGLTNIFFTMLLLAAGITVRMFAFYRGWKLPDL